MQLPFSHKNDQSPRRYVFGLEISPGVIKCAIWTLANNKPQVVAASSPFPWDDKSAESLISAVDQCLTEASTRLDPSGKTQISEVIFGLPTLWVNKDKIIQSRLALLKEMSIKLELKAVGFVVTPEAIIKLLQQTENVPATAILIGFWETEIEVALVKMGKIIGTQVVKRSQNLTSDVVEGLTRFGGQEVLPSRMLLYDSSISLEEIKQMLLEYPWASSSKKIPFLHFPKIEVLPAEFSVKAVCLAAGAEVVWDQEHPEVSEVIEEASEDLGFVSEGEIPKPPVREPVEVPEYPKPPVRKLWWPKFNFSFKISMRKPKLLSAVVILFAVLLGLGISYWYLPKATVRVMVIPREFQAVASLSLGTQSVSTSVEQSQQIPTTGSKIVGDKAVGQVSISSTLDSTKTFPSGTILTSPSGIKFVTLAEVVVASASGSADNLVPGKTTVKVTAANIGTDSNLSAGTVFRVDSFAVTQVSAKNDVAMSGGSSRQVKAVSPEDVSHLESQVINQAKQQAQEKLTAQLDGTRMVIPESVSVTVANETLTPKVGEEGENLNIQVTAKASALTVEKTDLDQAIQSQLTSQIPQGFNIDQYSQDLQLGKTDKNKTTFKAKITAKLLPVVNIGELVRSITGVSAKKAQDVLAQIPGATQVQISVTLLPKWNLYLPHISDNIDLQIQAQ